MPTLLLEAGDDTESLVRYITNELEDNELDQVDVKREVAQSENLATEPLTITATLLLSAPLVIAVGRIIERWLENRNQLDHLRIVAEGFEQSDKVGKSLAEISKAHAKVSVEYRLAGIAPKKNESTRSR
jgi:hypothetical protein